MAERRAAPGEGASNTRRLEFQNRRAPQNSEICDAEALQQSEHDRADKGEGHIGRNNAQSADQSHEQPPWFTSLPAVTPKASKPFQGEKVSATVYPGSRQRCAAGDVVKEQ
jgi:hypothetical protein